mmetsp:Transcript_29040/g.61626  ORF Transcript_29040/g.61626 Transcript_29040/m.61626 type:complete len:222 (-) Transcript_29040:798-1463(-)
MMEVTSLATRGRPRRKPQQRSRRRPATLLRPQSKLHTPKSRPRITNISSLVTKRRPRWRPSQGPTRPARRQRPRIKPSTRRIRPRTIKLTPRQQRPRTTRRLLTTITSKPTRWDLRTSPAKSPTHQIFPRATKLTSPSSPQQQRPWTRRTIKILPTITSNPTARSPRKWPKPRSSQSPSLNSPRRAGRSAARTRRTLSSPPTPTDSPPITSTRRLITSPTR